MKRILVVAACFGLIFAGNAWARSGGVSSPKPNPKQKHMKRGVASFYGKGTFRLASGRRVISQRHLFVAHRTLPFGTRVLFKRGNRRTVATVLDRGPYIHGRTWDLSWRAAKRLGLLRSGTGKVRYRIVSRNR